MIEKYQNPPHVSKTQITNIMKNEISSRNMDMHCAIRDMNCGSGSSRMYPISIHNFDNLFLCIEQNNKIDSVSERIDGLTVYAEITNEKVIK